MSKGDIRCIDGRLWRHEPQYDDPDLETDVGQCPECWGEGCDNDLIEELETRRIQTVGPSRKELIRRN